MGQQRVVQVTQHRTSLQTLRLHRRQDAPHEATPLGAGFLRPAPQEERAPSIRLYRPRDRGSALAGDRSRHGSPPAVADVRRHPCGRIVAEGASRFVWESGG